MDTLEITLNSEKFGGAIREKRLQEGLSYRLLAAILGIPHPTLYRLENNDISNLEIKNLLAICCWLRMPPEGFFSGVPGSLRAHKHYLTHVNAGLPAPADDEVEYRGLYEDLIPNQNEYFTVTARGDSMIGAQIYDEDLLIVKASETADPGDIVIAIINGEYCVKRFERKGASVILRSANPAYDDIPIKKDDDFSVRGVVTHSIHRYQKGRQARR